MPFGQARQPPVAGLFRNIRRLSVSPNELIVFAMCRSPLTLLDLLDEVKLLCSADPLTARSFLYSLTLQQLPLAVEAGIGQLSEFVLVESVRYDTSKHYIYTDNNGNI